MAEVINAPPDSLDKSPPPSPSSASAPPPPPPPPPSLPPPSDSDLPPPPARRRDRRDDRDFDRPPNRRDYYDRSNNSPPPKDRDRDFKRRRSPSPPSQRDRDRRHSPPPPYKRSRRGSPRGGYRYGPDDSGFGYDNSGGYERGVGGRVGYVDDKSSGRFGHRSAGGHQNGISDVESNRGYADLPSGSAQREGLMSYKQFIQQLEDDILPAEAERIKNTRRSTFPPKKRTYFNSHKDEEWLKDKYHPTNLLTVIERFSMGKNDFLTPKAIANRIKAKGLQKLRWYCQMCQKQCRDENGFKCHCMSEGHQRQMQVFGQNPTRIIDGYSEEFEKTFLEHMKRSHRFSRIAATVVYNEYINDRHHVHMNSTEWATLTDFVKYLGRTGKCKVDETPKGWFITYIDRDSETLFKEKMKNKRIKADMADEEKQEREIMKQIEKAEQLMQPPNSDSDQTSLAEPPREFNVEDGVKIGFSLGTSARPGTKEKLEESRVTFDEVGEEKNEERKNGNNLKRKEIGGGKSALDEMMRDEEKKKEKMNRKDYWLHEGIVVKVMSKALAEKGYYKQKGVVRKVIDKYVGEIEMLESKHVLRVDQVELETVIPQVGGRVKIVNGAYRGSLARLLGVDTDHFCAKVQIEKGPYDGRVLKAVEYEDICKVAQ